MAIVQTDALVLRSHRLGETSLIVTLFTRDFGLLRCVAKGARGPKSRFGASLEPGVSIAAVVYRLTHTPAEVIPVREAEQSLKSEQAERLS